MSVIKRDAKSTLVDKALFNAIEDGIFVLDEDGKTVDVNERVCRMLSCSRDEIIGTSLLCLVPASAMKEVRQALESVRQSGKYKGEFPLQSSTGAIIDVEWNATRSGQAGLDYFVAHDISEKKRIQEELRKKKEELSDYMQHTPVGVSWIGREGMILWANSMQLEMLGYARDDYIGHHFSEFHADQDAVQNVMDKLTHAEPLHQFEAKLRCKDSSIRNVMISSTIVWEGQKFVLTRCYTRDITARKLSEDRIQFLSDASTILSSSLNYETTLQNLSEMVVPELSDWCCVDVATNSRLQRVAIAHKDPEKLQLLRSLDPHFPFRPGIKHGPIHVIRTNQSEMMSDIPDPILTSFTLNQQHLKDLRQIGLKSYLCVPLRVRDKTLGALTLMLSDSGRTYNVSDLNFAENLANRAALAVDNASLFTEIRQSREMISQQLKEKEVLVQEIHHRVKNNLQVISSLLHLQASQTDDQTKTLFRESQNRVLAMALIYEKLYKADNLSLFDLGQYIHDLCQNLYSSYEDSTEKIKLELSCDVVMIEIDKAIPCGLIVNEVLSNSIKHAFDGRPNGTIRVRVTDEATSHVLEIQDDGVGLPQDFDWKRQKSLGFRLIRMLVKQLGGKLAVEHSQGAYFRIEFQ